MRRRSGAVLVTLAALAAGLSAAPMPGNAPAKAAPAAQLRGVALNIFTAKTLGTAALTLDQALQNNTDTQLPNLVLLSALMADLPESLTDAAAELTSMKAAGAKVVRLTFPWALLETDTTRKPGDPPNFNQVNAARITGFFALTRSLGLKVIVNFGSVPCWRSSRAVKDCRYLGPWNTYPPANPNDQADAVREMINRWSKDIYAIEVWNEPNSHFFMSDLSNCDPAEPASLHGTGPLRTRAAAYVPMVKTIYNAVKSSIKPSIRVVADDSAFSDTAFLQLLYDNGMKGFYDAISVHPYHLWLRYESPPATCDARKNIRLLWSTQDPSVPFPDPMYSFTTGVQAIHSMMQANGDAAPLWFTEFGFTSCTAAPAALQVAVGQAKDTPPKFNTSAACAGLVNQGPWLAKSYNIAAHQFPYVTLAAMFTSRDPIAGENPYSLFNFGLLHWDFTPKPAYVSVRNKWACLSAGTC